ncbi:MAG: M48 family metallopeptidase [Candidatus Cloacimonetes bacterium]|nr:M48 family metallopeptidase [Candidatus Cloacimonadota bacterium]
MINKIVFTLLAFLILTPIIAEEFLIIQRDKSVLREGPGSFYPLLLELSAGTEVILIEKEKKWCKIRIAETEGYISERALTEKGREVAVISEFQGEAVSQASRHAVSAGIKGFAQNYSKSRPLDVNFLDNYENYSFEQSSYLNFRQQNNKYSLKPISNKMSISETSHNFDHNQHGLGLAIAASVVTEYGLFENSDWNVYIQNIGQYIVDSNDFYDSQFRFYIINLDTPNAYAFPGGIVFISKGMLKVAENEAEIAAVIAHEIAHIIQKHGMIETAKRKQQIKAGESFDELDREIYKNYGESPDETEKELEEISFEIFESIIQGRLDEYEKEADYLAMKYTYNSGYNPFALKNILTRIKNQQSNNQHYRSDIISSRLGWIADSAFEIRFDTTNNKSRFAEMKLRNQIQ